MDMEHIALNIVPTGIGVKLSKYLIFQAKIKVFSSHLSTYKANIEIISFYSHSYKTMEGIYGL